MVYTRHHSQETRNEKQETRKRFKISVDNVPKHDILGTT